jgi:hypothetical protein
VPVDRKWLTHHLIARAVVDAIEALDLRLPKMSPAKRRELETARRELESQGG